VMLDVAESFHLLKRFRSAGLETAVAERPAISKAMKPIAARGRVC
jgi:hypothetical protein